MNLNIISYLNEDPQETEVEGTQSTIFAKKSPPGELKMNVSNRQYTPVNTRGKRKIDTKTHPDGS